MGRASRTLQVKRVQVVLNCGRVIGIDDRDRLTRAVADNAAIEQYLIESIRLANDARRQSGWRGADSRRKVALIIAA